MTEHPHLPDADDEIVPAPHGDNPGADDGVGETVIEGMGHDGVRRIAGRFGDLGDSAPSGSAAEPEVDRTPSTDQG